MPEPTPPSAEPDVAGLIERLRKKLARGAPVPWCWEQCGEKHDYPVVGVAFAGDDPMCISPLEGEFRDADAYREPIAMEWKGYDRGSASANADLAVAAVNALTPLLDMLESLSASLTRMEAERDAHYVAADKAVAAEALVATLQERVRVLEEGLRLGVRLSCGQINDSPYDIKQRLDRTNEHLRSLTQDVDK